MALLAWLLAWLLALEATLDAAELLEANLLDETTAALLDARLDDLMGGRMSILPPPQPVKVTNNKQAVVVARIFKDMAKARAGN